MSCTVPLSITSILFLNSDANGEHSLSEEVAEELREQQADGGMDVIVETQSTSNGNGRLLNFYSNCGEVRILSFSMQL